jgi:transcriptional regulator with XRE-family HTH domain
MSGASFRRFRRDAKESRHGPIDHMTSAELLGVFKGTVLSIERMGARVNTLYFQRNLDHAEVWAERLEFLKDDYAELQAEILRRLAATEEHADDELRKSNRVDRYQVSGRTTNGGPMSIEQTIGQMALAETLREERANRGYTLRHVAELADTDFTTISKIESGHLVPSVALTARLADALSLDRYQCLYARWMHFTDQFADDLAQVGYTLDWRDTGGVYLTKQTESAAAHAAEGVEG